MVNQYKVPVTFRNTNHNELKWKLSVTERRWGRSRETWKRIKKEMAKVGKTWNILRWLVQDRSERQKLACAYASQGADSRGEGCS